MKYFLNNKKKSSAQRTADEKNKVSPIVAEDVGQLSANRLTASMSRLKVLVDCNTTHRSYLTLNTIHKVYDVNR